ncbi:MAG: hypothetical protein ACLQIB_28975 [Isosphaeraceae bacterium]
MTWQQFLNAKHKQTHTTSKQELDDLRAVIDRDLHDAGVMGLSADRSFATSYNAALQTAKMAIACAGYRVVAKVKANASPDRRGVQDLCRVGE